MWIAIWLGELVRTGKEAPDGAAWKPGVNSSATSPKNTLALEERTHFKILFSLR